MLNNQTYSKEFMGFVEEATLVVERMNPNFLNELESLLRKLIQTKSWLPLDKQVSDDKHYSRHSLYPRSLKSI